MEVIDHHKELTALADLGFLTPRFFAPNHWAAVIRTGSFASVVDGNRDALAFGYQNRWHYSSLPGAISALMRWSGEGQPTGYFNCDLSPDVTIWP